MSFLAEVDPELFQAVQAEAARQQSQINLIASENLVSRAVLEAQGSVLTNKYAEGYPGKRYYGGCQHVDVAESLAIARAKALFGADHANVQPHSGTQANMAAYRAVLDHGARILSMDLDHGGHLSHGHKVNFSGRDYTILSYGVHPETERIDYDQLEAVATAERPALIVAGASAYSRALDFERFAAIAAEVGAYLLVDMAHIAGLVAAGVHPDPVPHADIVTSTTHKTLRGPRGGLILCRKKLRKKINSRVFPGTQGGPLCHQVAAKAVCFQEALTAEFTAYQRQVVANAQAMAAAMSELGYRIVSGGTDNHLFLVDLQPKSVTGQEAEDALGATAMAVNKNLIPYDPQPPRVASGIRIGTPTLTSRGLKEADVEQVAVLIDRAITGREDAQEVAAVRHEVERMLEEFPVPDRFV